MKDYLHKMMIFGVCFVLYYLAFLVVLFNFGCKTSSQNSGCHFHSNMFRFLEELDEGVFIQQTLETLLVNADGKQLMVSAK